MKKLSLIFVLTITTILIYSCGSVNKDRHGVSLEKIDSSYSFLVFTKEISSDSICNYMVEHNLTTGTTDDLLKTVKSIRDNYKKHSGFVNLIARNIFSCSFDKTVKISPFFHEHSNSGNGHVQRNSTYTYLSASWNSFESSDGDGYLFVVKK
jgi:hypothetical protein